MSELQKQNFWSDLMAKAQAGDKDSYHKLLQEISPLVTRMIARKIRSEQVREDLFQNVLLNIHKARQTFDPLRKFNPWLYSVTRNTIYDYLRKNRKNMDLEVFV